MNTPGMSIFQGAESIQINNSYDRIQEEEEAAEDQRRRNEEVSIFVPEINSGYRIYVILLKMFILFPTPSHKHLIPIVNLLS